MVEIIPREAPQISPLGKMLFYLASGLFFISLIGYFVLDNSLKNSKEKLADLEALSIKNQAATEKVALEKEILTYKNKIDNFSSLISRHLSTSKIFGVIEEINHPKVWFSRFGLDTPQGLIELTGEAQDFESLAQQMDIIKEAKIFEKVELNNVSLTKEGKINFNLSLSFDEAILK